MSQIQFVSDAGGGSPTTTFVTDSGTATSVANTIDILGGTGINTSGATDVVTVSLTSPVVVGNGGLGITTTPSNGFIPIGNGTNYISAAITAGSGITVTNGSGSITLAASGSVPTTFTENSGTATPSAGNLNILGTGSISTTGSGSTVTISSAGVATWSVKTTDWGMVVNQAYFANSGSLITGTLPAVSAVGDQIEVAAMGTGLFKVGQQAGQVIHYIGSSTTTGVGGSITPITQFNNLVLTCNIASVSWIVTDGIGSFTVV